MMSKKMADLKKRFMISFSFLILLALLISFSRYLPVSILIALFMCAIVGIGIWEYVRLAKARQFNPHLIAMLLVGISVVIAFFLTIRVGVSHFIPICVLGAGFVVFFLMRFKSIQGALGNIAIEFFGVCYLSVPLSMMLGILYPQKQLGVDQEGRYWFLYLIAVTKIADIAAYFVGRLWGKTSLAPQLSPQKTIEGSIAGFLASVGMSVFLQYIGYTYLQGNFAMPLLAAIILGAFLGVFAQLGDLAESLLKRDAAVKDSNTLPGLGGMLDMVDSLLFTAPIIYIYLNLVG